jgi:hypothetical protein
MKNIIVFIGILCLVSSANAAFNGLSIHSSANCGNNETISGALLTSSTNVLADKIVSGFRIVSLENLNLPENVKAEMRKEQKEFLKTGWAEQKATPDDVQEMKQLWSMKFINYPYDKSGIPGMYLKMATI